MQDKRSSGPKGQARWRIVGIVVVLGAIFLGVSPGCSSLSKEDLEARLLELDKNAGLRELGLQRKQIEVDIRGTAETLELVYVHMPSTSRGVPRTPVFLVHGTPSTMFTWAEIALGGEGFAGLAAERDVYLLEVIGHGLGPSSPGPITFQVCADYVAAAVRSFELEPVFLVGQSYGGEFAWRAAADSPDQFAGLVLMSSSGVERRAGDWLSEEVQMRENSLADFGWLINSPDRVASALEPHFRQIPPDRVDEFFLVCENRSNWQAMIDLAQDENGDREDQLSRLGMPTLLLWGAEDAGYRPDYYARRFHEQIPDSRLVLIPETGHYAHEERPEVVLQYLSEFFASVERRP